LCGEVHASPFVFMGSPELKVGLVTFVVVSVVMFVGIIWHVIKYGEIGCFHREPPPSVLNPPPEHYKEGNLAAWAQEEGEAFKEEAERERRRIVDKRNKDD
jgi:hypothetical protein